MFWACFKFGCWKYGEECTVFERQYGHHIKKFPILSKSLPKEMQCYRKNRKDISLEYIGFKVLCPTRWTVKAESMKSILDNWVALQQVWDESLDGNLEPKIKGTIVCVKSQMNTFNYSME